MENKRKEELRKKKTCGEGEKKRKARRGRRAQCKGREGEGGEAGENIPESCGMGGT